MNMIALADLYDEPLTPETMDFTTKPGRACSNCLFQRQRMSVCDSAVKVAQRAGMPNCDDEDIVYVLREVDPRQMTITGE